MKGLNPRAIEFIEKPILEVKGLKKLFPVKSALGLTSDYVKAVNGVSFYMNEGETYGLVGESGCGKITLGELIMQL